MISQPRPLSLATRHNVGRLEVAINKNLHDKMRAEQRLERVKADRDLLRAAVDKAIASGDWNELVFVSAQVESAITYRQEGSW